MWSEYFDAWRRYGLATDSCLEIGCGAGRITRQLIQQFARVAAIDVSEIMLDIARRSAPLAEFSITNGTHIPHPENCFSAVFSCEVFQHFNSRDVAIDYFQEIFRTLAAGGTMMIHLPIAVLPFRRVSPAIGDLQALLWRATDAWQEFKSYAKRWLITARGRRPFYRLLQYEPDWLHTRLTEIGFQDVQIWLFPVTTSPGKPKAMGSHLFARTPTAQIEDKR
jgi:ubiquinone/menaquinone biosynthesis C-methylase UbiE